MAEKPIIWTEQYKEEIKQTFTLAILREDNDVTLTLFYDYDRLLSFKDNTPLHTMGLTSKSKRWPLKPYRIAASFSVLSYEKDKSKGIRRIIAFILNLAHVSSNVAEIDPIIDLISDEGLEIFREAIETKISEIDESKIKDA